MIEIRNLTKRFGEKLILDNVSLNMESPGMTALTGVSGSGKTTLIRLLLRLDNRYDGTIRGVPQKYAAVFQEDRLLKQLTAEQNVRFVRPDMDRTMLQEGFARLGMAGEMDTPVSQLSGGMKRRVSILRALLSDAELIVMDEPMKGLDEAIARRTAEYCQEMLRGRTLIYITHDSDEIAWMGIRRTIHLQNGMLK